MTGEPDSPLLALARGRQLAVVTVDALKKAGHIVVAPGGTEQLLRDLEQLIDPVLARILPKVDRSPIMGEVSSTFGDEATDEAVEELVTAVREALLDSDGVEDVFAEDRVIERLIFRTFAETLRAFALHHQEEEEEERPPISVRLDTLGYVAAAAAKSADDDTLREALDRAAEAAQSELKTFDDKTRTAFFRPVDPDPERRLDIESAIEEELSDLVDLGMVELPTVKKTLPLPELNDAGRKALRRRLDELAQKHLGIAVCPGSWDWSEDKRSILLVFTPLTEPDNALIDRVTETFRLELDSFPPVVADEAPPSARGPSSRGARATSAEPPPPSADAAFAMRVLKAAGATVTVPKAPPSRPKQDEPPPSSRKAPPKTSATPKAKATKKTPAKSTPAKSAPAKSAPAKSAPAKSSARSAPSRKRP